MQPRQSKWPRTFTLVIIGLLLGACVIVALTQWRRVVSGQVRPRRVDTTGKASIEVRKGDNLQGAINSAQPGDTIILEAGASFTGPIVLPNKSGSSFITITSSQLSSLPANGVRVSPNDAALMPKILTPGKGQPALQTEAGAHHFRIIGIEFAPANNDYIYNLVSLGTDSQKASEVPHHLEFDRCYVHQRNAVGITRRGFALNSAETTIANSYISGFAGSQQETQAIAGWNGPGPFHIINNYLEGGAENILIGGGDPSIQGLVPSDIEIRRNLLTKPASWRGQVTIKNVLELKNARRVQIVGNVIENGFDCTAITLTVRNQNGGAPWSTVEDVEIRSNIVRHAGSAINVLGQDNDHPSQKMKRLRIINNLFDDISHERWGADGYFLQINGGEDIRIEHNTAFHSGTMIKAYGDSVVGFVFRSNILSYNLYGVWGDGAGVGLAAIVKYLTSESFTDNVIVNGRSIDVNEIQLPKGNFLVPNFSAVGFKNQQAGDYGLAANSRFKGKGPKSADAGCDFDALKRETQQ